jgi:hypothetical protein
MNKEDPPEALEPDSTVPLGWPAGLEEPLRTAEEKGGHLSSWLSSIHWEDEELTLSSRMELTAAHFHPVFAGPGAALVSSLERGQEIDKQALAGSSPFIADLMPHRLRGESYELKFGVLVLFAMLCTYELHEARHAATARLHPGRVFMHLYWFERFFGVWAKEASTPPPQRWFDQKKQAQSWRDAVEAFASDYFKGDMNKQNTRCADAFMRQHGGSRHEKGASPVTWDDVNRQIGRWKKRERG